MDPVLQPTRHPSTPDLRPETPDLKIAHATEVKTVINMNFREKQVIISKVKFMKKQEKRMKIIRIIQ